MKTLLFLHMLLWEETQTHMTPYAIFPYKRRKLGRKRKTKGKVIREPKQYSMKAYSGRVHNAS
jgi:hypothetical protein